jgi:hypothetical protein
MSTALVPVYQVPGISKMMGVHTGMNPFRNHHVATYCWYHRNRYFNVSLQYLDLDFVCPHPPNRKSLLLLRCCNTDSLH